MKNFFQGKKAIITVPIAISLAIGLLPLTLGAAIGYFANKRIASRKIKLPVIAIVVILSLFMQTVWTTGLFLGTSNKDQELEQDVAGAKAEDQGETTEEVNPSLNGQAPQTDAGTDADAENPAPKGEIATVVKVVDGDTLSVSVGGKNETVRIIGINSPETVDPRKPVECFGQKASEIAKSELTGKTVQLEQDSTQGDRDKYSRLLRYVWLDANMDFGALMIKSGYAYEYTYSTPYKYQTEYKTLQKEAEGSKSGLWAENACPPKTAPSQTTSQTTQKPTSTTTSKTSGDKNCPDFKTHAEAQSYFNSNGGSASNNVDGLDNDRDGTACESLP